MSRYIFLLLALSILTSCSSGRKGAYYAKIYDYPTYSVTVVKDKTLSSKLTRQLFNSARERIFKEIGVTVNLVKMIDTELDCPFTEIEMCTWYLRDKLVKKNEIQTDIVYIFKDWKKQKDLKESPIRGFAEQVGAVHYKFPSAAISFNQDFFSNDSAVFAHEIAHLLGASHKRHGLMRANDPHLWKRRSFGKDAVKEIHAFFKSKDIYATFRDNDKLAGVIPMAPWSTRSIYFARPEL